MRTTVWGKLEHRSTGGFHNELMNRFLPSPSDRGDVPGWVLITLMTAGLVVVIWAMAGPALGDVFSSAIDRVLSI
jgi:hypothetical protein